MGRPSKLSDAQKAKVRERLIAGEKPTDLADEFGVHKSQITRLGTKPLAREREVATQLVNAEIALRELPPLQQLNVLQLADDLRATVVAMASAGKLGAVTSNRLASMAHGIVAGIPLDAQGRPIGADNMPKFKEAAGLLQLANSAASIPLAILSSQKVATARAVDNPVPKDMGDVTLVSEQDAAQAWQDLMRTD